ncbi:hypothetical protein NLK61_26375 [Pseudomonas fuscovaginae UPB0736]|uniref:hypothetical protein n=1 Tax=Pseudomonas asplenii TaxID=53407 RepID=UPI000288E42A|nr:hypothetical protein [Pseudomonas fuscovaginae]UUQ64686.1 hypothetical protein NLK61_26375 [Pseudomonas fuscovaginae UPB0736]
MDVTASLHELLAAFTSDLKGTEKHLKQSIADVGSEFRGSHQRLRAALDEKNNGLHTLLERQGKQIEILSLSIHELLNERQLPKEQTLETACAAVESNPLDDPEVEPIDQPEDAIDARGAHLEAAIKGLNSKNRLIQWYLGMITVSVAFPYFRGTIEQIIALCQF